MGIRDRAEKDLKDYDNWHDGLVGYDMEVIMNRMQGFAEEELTSLHKKVKALGLLQATDLEVHGFHLAKKEVLRLIEEALLE